METKIAVFVSRILKRMRGSSRSLLAETSDGKLYVIKLVETAQGANALFNDAVGTELYRSAGLLVPEWKPLIVPEQTLREAKQCGHVDPSETPSATICFASRYLGDDRARIFEILPGTAYRRIANPQHFWMALFLDRCANHCDNRQALFLERPDRGFDAFFIDHGHMFGGPDGMRRSKDGMSMYLDSRIYPAFSEKDATIIVRMVGSICLKRTRQIVDQIPQSWKTETGIQNFKQCCSNLSNPRMLADFLVEITHMTMRPECNGIYKYEVGRGQRGALLHCGVQ